MKFWAIQKREIFTISTAWRESKLEEIRMEWVALETYSRFSEVVVAGGTQDPKKANQNL